MTAETLLSTTLLVNSPTLPRWQRDALQRMVSETDAEITTVVLRDSVSRRDGLADYVRDARNRFSEYPLWSLVGVARTVTPDPAYKRQVPITTIAGVASAEWIHCRPVPADGLGNELPAETVERIADEADLAVRFGFGILKGEVLEAPTHGVLSYHFGDIRRYRGRPGGFWEFLADEDRIGVTVQRLSETLDGGRIVVLEHVDIDDTDTYQCIRKRCVDVARGLLTESVERLADPAFTPTPPTETGKLQTLPRGGAVMAYLLKNNRNRVRQLIGAV
ncbi:MULTISPECIES: formyltransferase family protein [Haloarcula]|uniref:formyltransferase family protein n=1 Tax=Haloarcula TaxID=2237 RepID=UPI0023E7A5E9|nr:formyltransferase family protein [Halomicroarcula sp. SHR3]